MSKYFFGLIVAFSIFTLTASAAEKYVKLVHVDSGKVLSIEGDSDDNEAKAVIAKDDASNKSQQWQLVKDGEFYKIVNRKSGRVLDVNNESTEEGGEIIQWDDKSDGNDNQRWSWDEAGDKDKKDAPRRLKSKISKLVLGVTSEDKVIQQKADEKSKGQLWKVVEVTE